MKRLDEILARCEAATPADINDDDSLIVSPSEYELIEFTPLVVQALKLAVGRLEGYANSSLYDVETKWAEGVLAEIEKMLGEEK